MYWKSILVIVATPVPLLRGKVRLQVSLHVKAAKSHTFVDSPGPSMTQSIVGSVLSVCTTSSQPG